MTSERLSLRRAAAHLWAAVRLALSASAGDTLGYLLNAVVAGVTPVVAAWQTKLVLDRLASSDGWPAITAPLAGLVALGVLMGVSPAIGQYLFGRLSRRVAVLAMDQLYQAVDRLNGMSRIEDPAFRDRLLMAQQAGRGGPGRLVEQMIGVGRTTLTVTGFLGTLLVLSPGVAVVAFAAAVPALMAQLRISRARAALFMRIAPMERRELHYAELLVSVPAAKELRLLGLGGLFRTRMVGEMRTANAAQDRQDGRELRTEGSLVALTAALTGGCLVWAVWLAAQGRFSVGDVAVFVAAIAGLQGSLQSIIELIGGAHEALLLFHQYRTVVAAGPDLPTPGLPGRHHAVARGHRAGRRVVPVRARPALGAARRRPGDPARSTRSRWSGSTARARARWSSCCAGSTTRPGGRSAGTASICVTWIRVGLRRADRRRVPGLHGVRPQRRREHRRRRRGPRWTTGRASTRRPGGPTPTTCSPRCPAGTTPCCRACSPTRPTATTRRAGRCCRAGSGSGSRWPGRSCATSGT